MRLSCFSLSSSVSFECWSWIYHDGRTNQKDVFEVMWVLLLLCFKPHNRFNMFKFTAEPTRPMSSSCRSNYCWNTRNIRSKHSGFGTCAWALHARARTLSNWASSVSSSSIHDSNLNLPSWRGSPTPTKTMHYMSPRAHCCHLPDIVCHPLDIRSCQPCEAVAEPAWMTKLRFAHNYSAFNIFVVAQRAHPLSPPLSKSPAIHNILFIFF